MLAVVRSERQSADQLSASPTKQLRLRRWAVAGACVAHAEGQPPALPATAIGRHHQANDRHVALVLVDVRGVLDTQPSDGNPARDTGPRNDSGTVWDRIVPGLGQQGGIDGLPCSRPRGGQDGLLVFPYSRRGRKMGLASTTLVLSQGLREEMRIERACDCRSPRQAQCHALRAPPPLD